MITFPNAKINLGLFIERKRPDGYHDISTIFYPIPLVDAVEIIPAPETELFLYGNPKCTHSDWMKKNWQKEQSRLVPTARFSSTIVP